MSPNVCHGGSQSCLDFNLFNTSPLRPSLPDSEIHKERNNMKSNDNIDMGGWSFLQSLTNSSEKVYVHTLQNNSSPPPPPPSKLSTKSLEMCTESLGSETGSNCSEEIIQFTSSLEKLEKCELPQPNHYKNWVIKKGIMKRSTSFPPPLTSITGVQLRPHREGGRLVLKAENVSSCHTYFQAERSGGRLRLHLLQNLPPNCNRNDDEEEEEEEEEVEEEEDVEIETEKIFLDVEETEEIEEDVKVRGEMGVKKVSMTRRCKEGEDGRKRLLSWEPFSVAS